MVLKILPHRIKKQKQGGYSFITSPNERKVAATTSTTATSYIQQLLDFNNKHKAGITNSNVVLYPLKSFVTEFYRIVSDH